MGLYDSACCWRGDFLALLRGKVMFLVGRVCLVPVNTASCPVCGCPMIRHGKTSTGRQRWRCKPCQITTLNEIDSTAKHLDEFLTWLLGRRRQVDLPGGGRSFRRRCEPLWQLWPFSPIIDEVHDVIFVDGIHLGRNAVVLIAQTPDCVLGWYAARSENSRAWGALMSRIAPPALVLTDAALENAWYHASQIHQATGIIPGWGDAICFNELHHTTSYHNTWD